VHIIALTDLHGNTPVIPLLADELRTAQLVLLVGDITHFGREREMNSIIKQFLHYNKHVLAVTGNCDYPSAEKYLAEADLTLNARVKEFGGFQLTGLSGSLPCPGRTPQEYTEEEFEIIIKSLTFLPQRSLLFVSHQPPFGTMNDQVSPGNHVGSKSIRKFIERQQPVICFTGHIHEGIAIDQIGETAVVNPGPAGKGNFALAEVEGNAIKSIRLCNLYRRNAT
jgi:Icc-related predicted phosphoesterase